MSNSIIVQFSEQEFKQLIKSCIKEGINENSVVKTENTDRLLSVKEASVFLNLAQQTLYGFTSNRTIPFIKKGKKLYFKRNDLETWLNEGKKQTIKEISENSFVKTKGGKHD
jgi:excisionase family DNA binding protein